MRALTILLTIALAALTIGALAAPAGAATRQCGNVTVSLGTDSEGGLYGIRATNVTCARARVIARSCVHGKVPSGWSARYVESTGRVILRSGTRRVSGGLAGGGGCGL